MSGNQVVMFDYEALPANEAGEVRAAAERIKVRLKRTAEDIIEIGKDLIEVKAKLGHGQFGVWLEREFELGTTQAQRFMQVAERFGKNTIMVDFKPTILYALAAPSVPDSVVEQAIEQVGQGEKVTLADVQAWKAEAEAERNARIDAEGKLKGKQQIIELLSAKLDNATPEVVEVVPEDYEEAKEKAKKLKEDLKKAKDAIKELKDKQAKAIEDGTRQGIQQRQSEIDDMERRKAELEKLIEARTQAFARFNSDVLANQTIKDECAKLALALGGFAAAFSGVELDVISVDARFQAERAKSMAQNAIAAVDMLLALPDEVIEKAA